MFATFIHQFVNEALVGDRTDNPCRARICIAVPSNYATVNTGATVMFCAVISLAIKSIGNFPLCSSVEVLDGLSNGRSFCHGQVSTGTFNGSNVGATCYVLNGVSSILLFGDLEKLHGIVRVEVLPAEHVVFIDEHSLFNALLILKFRIAANEVVVTVNKSNARRKNGIVCILQSFCLGCVGIVRTSVFQQVAGLDHLIFICHDFAFVVISNIRATGRECGLLTQCVVEFFQLSQCVTDFF